MAKSTVLVDVAESSPTAFSKSVLHADSSIKLVRLQLPAGKQIPAHHAPGDLTVLCLEGEVRFEVGQEPYTLTAGKLIYVPDKRTHALTAVTDARLLVTIIAERDAAAVDSV